MTLEVKERLPTILSRNQGIRKDMHYDQNGREKKIIWKFPVEYIRNKIYILIN